MSARTLVVDESQAGSALGSLVRGATGLAWSAARRLCERGKVRVDGVPTIDPGTRVRAGSEVEIDPGAQGTGTARQAATGFERARLVYLDPQVAVVNKPPGMNTVPFEPGERGTLVDVLAVALHRWGLAPATAPLFVVHRLDRETSGLLVFGRSWVAKRHLAGLFRHHDIERSYVALVHGRFTTARTLTSEIVQDRGDGLRGAARRPQPGVVGQRAVTHVRPLAFLPREGGATLLECTLETGRQHQIRIHLAEAGHPVIGERVYVREYYAPLLPAPRVMLHARSLGFTHPTHEGEMRRFSVAPPDDIVVVARRLGWEGSFEA